MRVRADHMRTFDHLRPRLRRALPVAALSAATLLVLGPSSSRAADEFDLGVRVNGVLKAYGQYYPSTNTMCVNLTNAPNPGSSASVAIYHSSGYLIDFTNDTSNDGIRFCHMLSQQLVAAYNGQP